MKKRKRKPSFFSVEGYIWKAMFAAEPMTDLRSWYADGWWTLAMHRPARITFETEVLPKRRIK